MLAKLISVEGTKVKIELTIELSESMLESEGKIQESLNEAGCIATRESMKHLDRDGSAIELGGKTWRTKGQQEKSYQTPYGEVVVARHVYQSAGGGKTYCPMERNARIIVTSTPMFAKQISSKMANGVAREVKRDLRENHGREVALSYIQNLSEAVGSIVQAKEEGENYEPPEIDVKIESVGIGLDGTCMLMCENGWREAMVGTISL
ncbi:MAG: ISKra4 family transposase, partial [Pseudanabaena sp.]